MRLHAAFALGAVASVGFPCLCVGRHPVVFRGQTNLIVWDATRHVEHFVRKAAFSTDDEDLGFIAPTPTVPELSEASDKAFSMLERLIFQKSMEGAKADVSAKTASKGDAVEVIATQRVGKFDATILSAKDPNALNAWLNRHGYKASPDMIEWFDFYIKKGWTFTAFKVAADADEAETGTIRMTFKTDRPFNPYRVPKANHAAEGDARLRLLFLSSEEPVATVGPAGNPWKASDGFAPITLRDAQDLAKWLKLDMSAMPPDLTVRSFTDASFATRLEPDDIYFSFKPNAPIAAYGLAGSALLIAAAYGLRRRRVTA